MSLRCLGWSRLSMVTSVDARFVVAFARGDLFCLRSSRRVSFTERFITGL